MATNRQKAHQRAIKSLGEAKDVHWTSAEAIKIMIENGLSISEVLSDLGMSPTTTKHWRLGHHPSVDRIERVLNHLGYQLVIAPIGWPLVQGQRAKGRRVT